MEETQGGGGGAGMVSGEKPGGALTAPYAAAATVLRLGKKMAIAGAAIASAPLVIPPLIVGLAFAFPFGVYYAGFAYTDSVMRALLTSPPVSLSSIDESEDECEDKSTNNGNALGAETVKLASAVQFDDDGHSRALITGGAGKKTDITFKGQTNEPSHVPSGIWMPTTDTDIPIEEGDNMVQMGTEDDVNIKMVRDREPDNGYVEQETKRKFEYTSIDGKDNIIRDIVMVQVRPVQARRGTEENEENEERGEREGNNKEKGKTTVKQEAAESPVYYPSIINDYVQKGRVNMDGEKQIEVAGKVDKENADLQEILGLATVSSEEKQPPTNIYSIGGFMPKESNCNTDKTIFSSDNKTDCTSFSSKSSSAVINRKEAAMNEEKHPDMTMEVRQGGMEGKVQDASPAAIESQAVLPAIHHSLPMVPEEHEREFKRFGLRSENALPTSYDIRGGTFNEVEGEFMTGTSIGEKKEADEVIVNEHIGGGSINEVECEVMKDPLLGGREEANEAIVIEQEGMELTQSNYVLTAVVSVTCNSAVELSAIEQNQDEAGIGKIISSSAFEKADEVMGERNIRGASSATTFNSEEHLRTVYHSFGTVAPLKSDSAMEPSCLSTEYASAVEDLPSDLTDAESGEAAITRETLGVVHSDDEVFYSDEIMWEQVRAIRTILGYKADLNPILADEIKVICIFTGVEPPVSLKDASDVTQMGEMLKFLKSVIGVK